MLDNEPTGAGSAGDIPTEQTTGRTNSDSSAGSTGADASPTPEPAARPARRRAARRPAGPPAEPPSTAPDLPAEAVPAAVIAPSPAPADDTNAADLADPAWPVVPAPIADEPRADEPGAAEPAPRRRATRSRRRAADPTTDTAPTSAETSAAVAGTAPTSAETSAAAGTGDAPAAAAPAESAAGTPAESAAGTPAESAAGTPAESAAGTPAEPAAADAPADPTPPDVAVEVTPPRTRRRRRATSAETETETAEVTTPAGPAPAEQAPAEQAPAEQAPNEAAAVEETPAPTSRRRRRSAGAAAANPEATTAATPEADAPETAAATDDTLVASAPNDVSADAVTAEPGRRTADTPFAAGADAAEPPSTHRTRVRRAPMVTFMAPDPASVPFRAPEPAPEPEPIEDETEPTDELDDTDDITGDETAAETDADGDNDEDGDDSRRRRRRGRRGRGRGRGENGGEAGEADSDEPSAEDEPDATASDETDDADDEAADGAADSDEDGGTSRRRRRRRRRGAGDAEVSSDDPPNTVVKVRQPAPPAPPRSIEDEVQGVKGSTRLEAKRQRRREGRESNRRRPPVLTEAEFLARREAVERVMVVRQIGDRTQIAVLEDDVLVEHYVTKASSTSYAGNVYLGRVQNVLPSMEAAFVDIGKGRNAVLYAGEVNWDAAGMEGRPRKIEVALKSGDSVLVQVTKDPIGHKGARLTSQVSLPGRFLVYVPEGQMTGISRKLPDTERKRLKDILKKIVPENAGVIIRTAAEGASEAELTHDVERLEAQWQAIKEKSTKGGAPALLNAEPDLVIRVIRDVFNEDFSKLVVSGSEAWPEVESYVREVSPDLAERLVHHTAETDVFAAYRIDDQLMKALDRKVWLPSGGSLVIDRTEAMTVVDVNTGKFTGQGGNLEETVTRNNLEAAEEIVRQLRLRDIGGIIVIDFIDMVLEGNRELVLRRLTECLGRDRTKHQVAEVTSLGLVQMTRKRVGQGLLEAFSETCETCRGRGVIIHNEPLIGRQTGGNGGNGGNGHQHAEPAVAEVKEGRRSRRKRGGGGGGETVGSTTAPPAVAAVAAIHAASTRAAVSADDDDADDALVVDEIAETEGDLAYDVADAEIETVPTSGIGTAHAAAADAVPATDPVKPTDQMVVNGAATVPVVTDGDVVLVAEPAKRPRRARRAASRPAGPPEGAEPE
ncbi:Rne/Rng family ribonuclease [Cryptosporangium japonicum]